MDREQEKVLIEKCRSGDEAAWTAVYDSYWPVILRFIYRSDWRISFEEARELTQDVFVKAVRTIARFRGDCSLKSWLFRIATNCVLDWQARCGAQKRGSGVQPLSLEAALEGSEASLCPAGSVDGPIAEVTTAELVGIVLSTVDRLPVRCRRLIMLRFFEGLSYEEIGQVLGLNPKTVSSRLSRCLSRLRRYVQDELRRGRSD